MKKKLILLCLLPSVLLAAEPISHIKETEPSIVILNEIKRLDHLIAMTEKSLNNQKLLKNKLMNYQKLQLDYLENQKNKEITLKLVAVAYDLQQMINETHMNYAFDTEFLSQLAFFAKFADPTPKP
jgi:hypothetical protein